MQKWEYKVFRTDYPTSSIENINELGLEGWELVGIASHEYTMPIELFFKRPKP
jgi:hypothetical protein